VVLGVEIIHGLRDIEPLDTVLCDDDASDRGRGVDSWAFKPSEKSPDLVRFLWVLIIKKCFNELFCVERHTVCR